MSTDHEPEESDAGNTTISVTPWFRDYLRSLKRGNETYAEVISRICEAAGEPPPGSNSRGCQTLNTDVCQELHQTIWQNAEGLDPDDMREIAADLERLAEKYRMRAEVRRQESVAEGMEKDST